MSSGMFRGKESSNRIELSRLVQEFWCFWLPVVLGVGAVGGWGWGVVGGDPHTCAHVCTCTHAHACVLNMIISCKWPPPFGESLGILYDVIHACACMCVCVYMCGVHPLTTYPPAPRGDPRNQSKFNSTWTNWDISIPFEDLKFVETSPPMTGCMVWWLGGWVGGLMGGIRSND